MNLGAHISIRPSLGAAARSRDMGLSLGRNLVLLIMITAAALFYAYASVKALNISYQVSRAITEQRELRETGRRFKVELNILRAPERLEREARRLGLDQADQRNLRVLR